MTTVRITQTVAKQLEEDLRERPYEGRRRLGAVALAAAQVQRPRASTRECANNVLANHNESPDRMILPGP